MIARHNKPAGRKSHTRSFRIAGASAALLTLWVFNAGGCSTSQTTFSAAASDSFRTGLSALFDGLVNGLFAIVDQNTANASTSGTTTTTTPTAATPTTTP